MKLRKTFSHGEYWLGMKTEPDENRPWKLIAQ